MTRSAMIAALFAWFALAACQESTTSLVTDTGSDPGTDHPADTTPTDPGVEPTVPPCTDVPGWDLVASDSSSSAGSVTVQVDLESGGVTSGCAGSPCLIVTVASGDGTATDITQVGSNRATFVYTDSSAVAGDSAQLLLRWRVLCMEGGSDEERTVTSPVWICAGSGAVLTVSDTAC